MRLFMTAGLLLIFITGSVFANENTAGEKLLALIEFDTSMEKLSIQMQNMGKENPAFTDEVKRDWAEVAAEAFQPEKFIKISAAYLNERLTAEQFEKATIFFTSDLGARMTVLETVAQDPKNIGRADQMGPKLLADYVTQNPERLKQIEAMINILGGVEDGVAMAMNMAFALNSAIISSGDNPNMVTDAQLLNAITGQYDAIFVTVKNTYLNSLAYTYQDATNQELHDYIVFLESDLARKIYTSMSLVLRETLTLSATQFGKELMKRARSRKL